MRIYRWIVKWAEFTKRRAAQKKGAASPSAKSENHNEWKPFGTHIDIPGKLEFRGEDEAGMPTNRIEG